MESKDEIHIGFNSYLNVQTSKIISLDERLILMVEDQKSIELKIKIEADFNTIPEEYHEIFLNMITSKYYNKVSFSDNLFSQCCKPKRKWYEFWKAR